MNLKNGKIFTSKFVGTGPSPNEKRIYLAAVTQNLRNTGLKKPSACEQHTTAPTVDLLWAVQLGANPGRGVKLYVQQLHTPSCTAAWSCTAAKSLKLKGTDVSVRNCRLLPRCKLNLRSSRALRRANW